MKQLMFLVLCAGVSFNLFAQEEYLTSGPDQTAILSRMVPNTVDIRSIGMGKTEVAGKAGSNALFSNPSLLALQEKGNIKLGTSLNFGFQKNESLDEIIDETNADIRYGYKPGFKLTNVAAAVPIHLQSVPLSIAFGAGYQNAINMSFTTFLEEELSGATSNVKYRYTGGLNTVTPGFAIGGFDRFSAGFSLNIGFGKMRTKIKSELENGLVKDESEMSVIAPGKAVYPTFGFSGKPLENMTIGISVSPPYEWEIDEIEIETESDLTDEEEYEMEGGEFTMPLKFSVGMEYQITPNFALAVEYQARPFESFECDADAPGEIDGMIGYENMIDSMDLETGHVLHFGTEIIAGKVPVRLGFFIEPYACTDVSLRNSIIKYDGKPNYMMGGTFGLGIPAGNSAFIDFAAQYGYLKTTYKLPKKYTDINHLIRVDLGLNIDLPAIATKKAATPSPQKTNTNLNAPAVMPDQNNQPVYPPYPQTAPENTPGQYGSPDSNSSETPAYPNQNSGY